MKYTAMKKLSQTTESDLQRLQMLKLPNTESKDIKVCLKKI